MIATPLINQEQTIPVRLPSESKSVQVKPSDRDRFVAVAVDARGGYYLDNRPIPLDELRTRLQTFGAESRPPIIRIRGDAAVPYEKIVQLMDELKKANLLKFNFDTQPQD
jgi:biopolymer transport protein ExbD